MTEEKEIFEHLKTDVINTSLCVVCATCVSVCPVNVIDLVDGLPKLIGNCIECGLCYSNCPRTEFTVSEIEENAYGRSREDDEDFIGVTIGSYAARTIKTDIQEKAQDGGVVTSLLVDFLDKGGDGVIVAGLKEDQVWVPKPVLASSKDEVISNAGTKYTSSPTMIGVKRAVSEKKEKIAVVGTPCQITGLARTLYGERSMPKIAKTVDLRIGLFCMETFDHDSFLKYLDEKEIDPKDVTKFEIKNGRFYANKNDEVLHRTRLKNVKKLVRQCCHKCGDFTSELADISVGNVGSPNGWSTVLVRSQRGLDALKSAEEAGLIKVQLLSKVEPGISLVLKLAEMKKKQV